MEGNHNSQAIAMTEELQKLLQMPGEDGGDNMQGISLISLILIGCTPVIKTSKTSVFQNRMKGSKTKKF